MALLAGIEKMKKPELVLLCEKYKMAPGTVADMKYKLKRLLEDAAEPDAKKAKTAATSVLTSGAVRRDISGDFCYPKGSDGCLRLLCHCVCAQAGGGKWDPKEPAMDQLSRAFGTEPQVQYEALGFTKSLGDVQFVPVTGNKSVVNMFVLGVDASGVPVFNFKEFNAALREVQRKAKADGATVHIHRPAPPYSNMDWSSVEMALDSALVSQGIDTWVYTSVPRSDAAPAAAAPVAAPAAAPAAPAPAAAAAAPSGGSRAEYISGMVKGKGMDDFPLASAAAATLRRIEKDSQEFWDLEEKFYANVQGRNEDYVESRIKEGKRPIKFVLVGAQKVESDVLECRFELKRIALEKSRGQKQRPRVSFHATHPKNVASICKTSLLRFKHPLNPCKKQVDDGYFGTNKKGVYVSRYADYTLKYANNVVPLEPKEVAKTIMFKTLPGKSKHFTKMPGAINPTAGFDSHSSPTYMEWYLFDEAQCCPEYICEVRAEEDTRTKSDDE